jgi:hypothetical protein
MSVIVFSLYYFAQQFYDPGGAGFHLVFQGFRGISFKRWALAIVLSNPFMSRNLASR